MSARGGTPGNLYVVLTVKPHQFFKRQGNDILYELPISFTQAALGDEVEVPTVDGKSTTLKIPAGTQSNRSFRLKGMGVPVVHSSARGDEHVIVKVVTPTNLTKNRNACLKNSLASNVNKMNRMIRTSSAMCLRKRRMCFNSPLEDQE